MKLRLTEEGPAAEKFLPENQPDGSDVGVNYADAYLKPFKVTLDNGWKVLAKRRGLKITVTVGPHSGSGLLRRLEHGPDVRAILRAALEEAVANAGGSLHFEDRVLYLQFDSED
jgi:hypothetical protein